MQDGFLSVGALEGVDSDHPSPCPLLFLQFVTNCSSGHVPPTMLFTINGTNFPCWVSVLFPCNSCRLSLSLYHPGLGESPGGQVEGELV